MPTHMAPSRQRPIGKAREDFAHLFYGMQLSVAIMVYTP
jgi:hypothetical protein